MSSNRRGLEEFFPPGALESDNETKDLENVKTGEIMRRPSQGP